MKKKLIISSVLNALLILMVEFASICMFTGFTFMQSIPILTVSKAAMFKFFTVDSNIFLGITATIMLICDLGMLFKCIDHIPTWVYRLKMAGTVGVTLTFLVTACYLAPVLPYEYIDLFKNSNLFFHFLVPVISIISFLFTENDNKLTFEAVIFGIVPVFLYACYYVPNVIIHTTGNTVSYDYDFYGFTMGRADAIYLSAAVIFLITFVISLSLWGFNKKLKTAKE